MEPELISIRLVSLASTSSVVEVKYKASGLHGIELMGVDAGLSWIKGESIRFDVDPEDQEIYITTLIIDESCEFRARGFLDDADYWEDGLANHRIIRKNNGSIQFETHLEDDMYTFRGDVPINYQPSYEDVTKRIENLEEERPKLLQLLVDTHIWIKSLFEDPLDQAKIQLLPGLQRYIKSKAREFDSASLDELVRPTVKNLFEIYRSALEFGEEDPRLLSGDWSNKGIQIFFTEVPIRVKLLEEQNLGIGKDTENRFRNLLKYS